MFLDILFVVFSSFWIYLYMYIIVHTYTQQLGVQYSFH